MGKELYNWSQGKAYSVIALYNLINKNETINLRNFIKELDVLQTMYGKEGVSDLANRYLHKEKTDSIKL